MTAVGTKLYSVNGLNSKWFTVGRTAAHIHRVHLLPPAERPRKFRSIYSCHSDDDTSCYVSDDTKSLVDLKTNVSEIHNFTHSPVAKSDGEESYRTTLNRWRLREQLNIHRNIYQPSSSNRREFQANSTRYTDAVNDSFQRSSHQTQQLADTNLNDLLEDIDKIADFNGARANLISVAETSHSHELDFVDNVRPSVQRWFVLVVICVSIAIRSFVSVVFGQINDIFSRYFSVNANAIDWLTNTSSVITLISIVVLIAAGGRRIKVRPLCLAMTGSAFIGIVLLTASVMYRDNGYALALAGQIILGINNAIAVSIPPIIAATWFPRGQVASALSTTFVSVGLAEALGSYLPGSALFGDDNQDVNFAEISGTSSTTDDDVDTVGQKLLWLFAIPAILSAGIFVVAIAFFKEQPSYPPSEAQALIRANELRVNVEGALSMSRSSMEAANEIAPCEGFRLLRSKCFSLVTFTYGVVAASASTSITLLSSILTEMDFADGENSNANSLSGNIMAVLWISFTVGPFIAGLILDRFGKYRPSAIASVCGVLFGTLGIHFAMILNSVVGLYITHAMTGFFMGAAETTLFEIAAEITYPSPELSFSSILNVSWTIFFIIYPVVGRLVIESESLNVAYIYLCPTIFNVLSALLTIFSLYPIYRRRAGNERDFEQSNILDERSLLLPKAKNGTPL